MTHITHERSTRDLIKAAVSGWLGTALEFMDFQLYSLGAALVFHEIFFPEQSAAMALILAMGTYGAGYIARIIGAFVFLFTVASLTGHLDEPPQTDNQNPKNPP